MRGEENRRATACLLFAPSIREALELQYTQSDCNNRSFEWRLRLDERAYTRGTDASFYDGALKVFMVALPARELLIRVFYAGLIFASSLSLSSVAAQVIDFESNGLHYQAMTRDGVTVTFAKLLPRIANYSIIQVTVTNGSPVSWSVRPQDFTFYRQDGESIRATDADLVISSLLDHASKRDVVKLEVLYEASIYALPPNYRSTAGYEHRREQAMTIAVNAKFKAAAAASAITLVPTKLKPGGSTDGAVFFLNQEKLFGPGRLVVNTAGEIYQFDVFPDVLLKTK